MPAEQTLATDALKAELRIARERLHTLESELLAAQERATEDARLIGSLTERGARAEARLHEAQEREKALREADALHRSAYAHLKDGQKAKAERLHKAALAGPPSEKTATPALGAEKPGSEEDRWLAWSGGRYPDESPGDVIHALSDGTITLDDGVTTWNPLRALEWIERQRERNAGGDPDAD